MGGPARNITGPSGRGLTRRAHAAAEEVATSSHCGPRTRTRRGESELIRIGIIIGSTRPGRNGDQVAQWVRDLAVEHAGDVADFELVDLKDYALPLLDEPVPARMAPGRRPHTQRWAERIGSCDAFIVVTPEYNTAPPAALTNAIDYLY